MKKEKKPERTCCTSLEGGSSPHTSSSSLSLNESVVELDAQNKKNGCIRVESKLLERNCLIEKDKRNNFSTSSSTSVDSSLLKKTALKPVTLTVYLLSCLFLFQLVLTTIGFYLQFSYLKNQNELFETKINSFFNRIITDLNTDFNELLRQQIMRKRDQAFDPQTDQDDSNFMILNLTHEIDLNELNVDELNKTVLNYQQNLFDAVLKENLNSRIKRNTKPSSSFYHKVNNYNQTNSRSNRHQGDAFFLTDKQPKNFSGDHFLIQAYSKISVCF